MKKSTRILCLFLSLSLLLPLLAACGDAFKPEGNSSLSNGKETGDNLDEDIFEDLGDYNSEEIVISLSKHTSAQITMESYQYIQGPDQMTSDSVLNKVYDRNIRVSEEIDVIPRYVYTSLMYDEILPDVQNKVLAPGKNTPDIYIDQIYGMIRSQQAGFLKNAIGSGSKLDLQSNGWYYDYMQAFNFHSQEKLYLLAGDYTMDVLRFIYTIGCNLTTFENLFMKEGGTKLLYDTVENGQWTLDQMMEWCELAFSDTGKTKGMADPEDQLGLATINLGIPVMSWMPSMDIMLYDVNERGDWSVFQKNDERAIRATDKLIALFGSTQGVLFAMEGSGINTDAATREVFLSGNTLFSAGVLLSSLETTEYQQMEDDKCVIPYPKLDATDDYCVTTHDGSRVAGILICTEEFEAVTAWLQAMTLTSTDILDEYYNVALKFKYGTDIGTTKMLDIIYENLRAPYWMTASAVTSSSSVVISKDKSPLSFWSVGSTITPTNTYVSKYTAIKGPLASALKNFRQTFDQLD